jgi:hypothetical protein
MVSLLLLIPFAAPAAAEPTRVMVRAQSTDAKFIGTSMGGVEIVLKDVRTGKILTSGLTSGGTGDTKKLVTDPRIRGAILSDAKSAGFETLVDIARPTLVRVEAHGPAGKKEAAITVSSTFWLLPGRHLTGDGLILTFPGLVVEPDLVTDASGPNLVAKVTLMCGCPLEAGGVWDAGNYVVTAHLLDGQNEVARNILAFSGNTSHYSAPLKGVKPGRYTLQVTAADKTSVNTGVGEKLISIK